MLICLSFSVDRNAEQFFLAKFLSAASIRQTQFDFEISFKAFVSVIVLVYFLYKVCFAMNLSSVLGNVFVRIL